VPGTRQLIVTDLKHIKSGHTRTGEPYTLWQVRATGLDGIPIEQNLRTFEELPRDIPVTVQVEFFKSDRGYGDSYTLKQVTEGAAATTAAPSAPPPVKTEQKVPPVVEDLVRRVTALEEDVQKLKGGQQTEVRRSGGPEQPVW
jgi:hypothetical protein